MRKSSCSLRAAAMRPSAERIPPNRHDFSLIWLKFMWRDNQTLMVGPDGYLAIAPILEA
jgi:hypothetical protein